MAPSYKAKTSGMESRQANQAEAAGKPSKIQRGWLPAPQTEEAREGFFFLGGPPEHTVTRNRMCTMANMAANRQSPETRDNKRRRVFFPSKLECVRQPAWQTSVKASGSKGAKG
ncbi:hypothetical protein Nepgr_027202 [Nepenthes gracilis]|uniref:Uncharacterized protein n=1 Tax=Nepenthes gracilis TaxID=150966 RepID=A0AAD3T9X0_NEPGR|nr:hypothetical protein Nepgr_027202 [Nepenthes gracilis]